MAALSGPFYYFDEAIQTTFTEGLKSHEFLVIFWQPVTAADERASTARRSGRVR